MFGTINKCHVKENKEIDKKQIFLTKCGYCGKRIAVMVENDYKAHGGYTCNDCVPEDRGLRNGIDEALETDLFDKYNI